MVSFSLFIKCQLFTIYIIFDLYDNGKAIHTYNILKSLHSTSMFFNPIVYKNYSLQNNLMDKNCI